MLQTVTTKSSQELEDEKDGPSFDLSIIGDGICNEESNFGQYSFDGGDCCLDVNNKDTSLCKNCPCILTINEDRLEQAFLTLKVKKLKEPDLFIPLIKSLTHMAIRVESEGVCTTLCLSEDLVDGNVNGWSYDSILKACTCAFIGSNLCLEGMDLDQNPNIISKTSATLVAYIQTSKISNVCQTTTTTTTTTTASVPWITLDNGMEVLFVTEPKWLHAAIKNCVDLGGRLYEPRTNSDMELVSSTACNDYSLCSFWIGVSDFGQDYTFYYLSDKTNVPGYIDFWAWGEPDHNWNEQWVLSDYGQWRDLQDTIDHGSVCEREPCKY